MNQINETLLATRNIRDAAILRRKDGAIKAKTLGFFFNTCKSITEQLVDDELSKLSTAMDNPQHARTSGFELMSSHYKAVRADGLSLYGKNESGGVICARTTDFFIIGTYEAASMQPAIAVEAVEKLAEYMRQKAK
ncbi:Profilin/allergen [Gonapodya prolifera JEL478]|uniref:Profilin n=1 Tax=Gonapodya prolifera (strain JEL478) TaxID=1344416 RepID=A0A139AZY5_GONPJ|nr:Profilin/allergen [Gonapodya prolifera JEL478]|eukprot:KXS22308.1 Profilin/allergen [Gonapodya prolifera JEL478]